jgi:hypothetical protein
MKSMGFLDKIKKSLEEAKKLTTQPARAPTPSSGAYSRYERLAAWIKTRYGNRFRDGVKNSEVEAQLQNIFKELETKGAFRKYPKIANGFRTYINEKKYGDLVRVIE